MKKMTCALPVSRYGNVRSFLPGSGLPAHCVKRHPFTIRTYSNYNHNKIISTLNYIMVSVVSFPLCHNSVTPSLEKRLTARGAMRAPGLKQY